MSCLFRQYTKYVVASDEFHFNVPSLCFSRFCHLGLSLRLTCFDLLIRYTSTSDFPDQSGFDWASSTDNDLWLWFTWSIIYVHYDDGTIEVVIILHEMRHDDINRDAWHCLEHMDPYDNAMQRLHWFFVVWFRHSCNRLIKEFKFCCEQDLSWLQYLAEWARNDLSMRSTLTTKNLTSSQGIKASDRNFWSMMASHYSHILHKVTQTYDAFIIV